MIDSVNTGANQLAEALNKQAGQGAEQAAGGSAPGGSQVDNADQARFQQAMGGADPSSGPNGVTASDPATSVSTASANSATAAPPSAGENILASLDKMRSGMADAAAGIEKGAASGQMLSQQELMQAQLSMVNFSTTEQVYSKVAGTAKSGLDKLLGS